MTRFQRKDIAKLWVSLSERHDRNRAIQLLAKLIIEQRRGRELRAIIKTIYQWEYEQKGVVTMTLTTARPISHDREQEIIQLMQRITKAKSVHVEKSIHPEIIGGFIAEANSQVIDASIKRSIHALESV